MLSPQHSRFRPLGRSNGVSHAIKGRMRRGRVRTTKERVYTISVFLTGFILGSMRILLIAPRLGQTIAVIVEVSFILTASWFCRCA